MCQKLLENVLDINPERERSLAGDVLKSLSRTSVRCACFLVNRNILLIMFSLKTNICVCRERGSKYSPSLSQTSGLLRAVWQIYNALFLIYIECPKSIEYGFFVT
jgi:hypothetical protein